MGVAADGLGGFWIADTGNNVVRRLVPMGTLYASGTSLGAAAPTCTTPSFGAPASCLLTGLPAVSPVYALLGGALCASATANAGSLPPQDVPVADATLGSPHVTSNWSAALACPLPQVSGPTLLQWLSALGVGEALVLISLPTPSQSPTASQSPSWTPTASQSPSWTPTASESPSWTPTPTQTVSPESPEQALSGYIIRTIAGTPGLSLAPFRPNISFIGLGGPATDARLYLPSSVAADGAGGSFFLDGSQSRPLVIQRLTTSVVKHVRADGTLEVVAGNTSSSGHSGDFGPATLALLSGPRSIAFDTQRGLLILDSQSCVSMSTDACRGGL